MENYQKDLASVKAGAQQLIHFIQQCNDETSITQVQAMAIAQLKALKTIITNQKLLAEINGVIDELADVYAFDVSEISEEYYTDTYIELEPSQYYLTDEQKDEFYLWQNRQLSYYCDKLEDIVNELVVLSKAE